MLQRFSETCELCSSQRFLEVRFSLLSIIIMATVNGPRKTEANRMDRNPPITSRKCDLLTLNK